MGYQKDIIKYFAIVVLATALFVLDINTELGIASGINYVLFVLLALWLKEASAFLVLGAIATGLILLGWYISPTGGEEWKVLLNRIFSIVGVVSICIVLFFTKKKKITEVNIPELINKQYQRSLAIIVLLFIAGIIFLSVLYRNNIKAIEQDYFATKQKALLSLQNQTEAVFATLFSDILFLSYSDNCKNIYSSESGKKEITNDFIALTKVNKYYDHVRFIDIDGHEVIRVNAGGVIVSDSLLQDKSSRNYYKESLKLEDGQVYVSEIDLNKEHGKIEIPHKPVLRVACKVKDEDGKEIGVIVINFKIKSILNLINEKQNHGIASFQLINKNGYWLTGVDSSNLYGFIQKQPTVNNSFRLKNPGLWNYIQQYNNGKTENEINSIVFKKVELYEIFHQLYSDVAKISNENSTELIFVYFISNSNLQTLKHKNLSYFVYGLIIYLLSFILIVRYFIKKQDNLKTMKHELLTVNSLLKELEKLQIEMQQQIDALNVSAIVSETDTEGNITFVNDVFCEISGYSREELLGKNHRILKSGKQPDGLFVGMWKAIAQGKLWHGEVCNKRKDGTFYWVATTIVPFFDEKGELNKHVSIRFDISKQKEQELSLKQKAKDLNRINSKLGEVNKELEAFSYSVSHDLKAPLRALQGFSDNLYKKYNDKFDETGLRWLQYVKDNAVRMDQLIQDMLSFSRLGKSVAKLSLVDTASLVDKIIQSEQNHYKNKLKLSIGELHNVKVDPTMFEMLWQNLIGNAFKYSSTKEEIEITIDSKKLQDKIEYSITDNGVGFDMKYYDKLFEVFNRLHTDDEFEGTGIGLANVKRIIDKHNGTIKAISELNKGTTFIFTIPN